MTVLDQNRLIMTGENPFIRLSATDDGPITTNASFWRIIMSPAGPGHVLYIKSELTDNAWRIYSDNIAMARWLQETVQGMLNAELADLSIPVRDAQFSKSGDARDFWTEELAAPASAAFMCCTACAPWACACASLKPAAMSAAPGTGTAIPAAGATWTAWNIPIPSTTICNRNGNGRNATAPRVKFCATSTMSRIATICAAISVQHPHQGGSVRHRDRPVDPDHG